MNRTIIPPRKGWEPHTWYSVEISTHDNNPIFYGLLFTGYLTDAANPFGLHNILTAPYCEGDKLSKRKIRFLRGVKKLASENDIKESLKFAGKLPRKAEDEIFAPSHPSIPTGFQP